MNCRLASAPSAVVNDFPLWMDMAQLRERILATAQERGRIINKFADLLEEHTDELAALDSCAAVPPLYPAHVCMEARP